MAGRDLTLEAATLVVAELGKRRGGGAAARSRWQRPPWEGPRKIRGCVSEKKTKKTLCFFLENLGSNSKNGKNRFFSDNFDKNGGFLVAFGGGPGGLLLKMAGFSRIFSGFLDFS